MKKLLTVASVCFPLIYTMPLSAHNHDSLGAHEHGKLAINVVLTDNTLEIELDGPAASITGFEYVPTSEADKKIALQAKQQLDAPDILFALSSGAQCQLTEKTIEAAVFDSKEDAAKHHHSDVEAHYSFSCKQPNALTQLDFAQFFKTFPLTKQINLQFIGNDGQKGDTLVPNKSQFQLSK